MTMNPTIHTLYRSFWQTVSLLVLYSTVALFNALRFLPSAPLEDTLPYHHVQAFSHILLKVAIFSGLMTGGLYVLISARPEATARNQRALLWGHRLWTGFVGLALLMGVLGQTDGRHMLELPFWLSAGFFAILVGYVLLFVQNNDGWGAFSIVFITGFAIATACHALGMVTLADPAQDRIWRVLSVNLQLNVGFVLMSVALIFWQIRRFSQVSQEWADKSLYNVGGLLALAGGFVSLSPLYALGINNDLGVLALVIVPVLLAIFGAHIYRALSSHHASYTLSGHWVALSVLLCLLSLGGLGAITAIPSVAFYTQGTRLTDLQSTLIALSIVSALFGMTNQAIAEMRGENRRVTGLLPFWLVSFGIIGGGLALCLAGVVQVYMERLLTFGYLDTQTALAPLYTLWVAGLVANALGMGIYALGLRARHVQV